MKSGDVKLYDYVNYSNVFVVTSELLNNRLSPFHIPHSLVPSIDYDKERRMNPPTHRRVLLFSLSVSVSLSYSQHISLHRSLLLPPKSKFYTPINNGIWIWQHPLRMFQELSSCVIRAVYHTAVCRYLGRKSNIVSNTENSYFLFIIFHPF